MEAKDRILEIIYKNSSADENGLHISFKQLESIVELLLIEKMRTRVDMAKDYMSRKGITFGSGYGDEMGIDLFIAGMEARENKYQPHMLSDEDELWKELQRWCASDEQNITDSLVKILKSKFNIAKK